MKLVACFGFKYEPDFLIEDLRENRVSRAEIHKLTNTVDNGALGFDYLADETNLKLEEIPAGREFNPPYTQKYIFQIPERFYQGVA